jgi:putrescine:ornithine antiporter
VVTNVVPYIIALSALPVIMQQAGVSGWIVTRNLSVATIAILYSIYALYASGGEAVMGGILVMGVGWLVWAYISPRFGGQQTAVQGA